MQFQFTRMLVQTCLRLLSGDLLVPDCINDLAKLILCFDVIYPLASQSGDAARDKRMLLKVMAGPGRCLGLVARPRIIAEARRD